MIRISSVNLPNKRFVFALSIIKGIGPTSARDIARRLNIDPQIKLEELSEEKISEVRDHISQNYVVEGDLIREVRSNIKRLRDISSWRGLRHKAGLPVRGQTTKNNNRTVRGNKRITSVSGRAKAASKT